MPWVEPATPIPDCGLCPNSMERHRIVRYSDNGRWVALCPASFLTVSDVTDQELLSDVAEGLPI